jgi:hypothetical protein
VVAVTPRARRTTRRKSPTAVDADSVQRASDAVREAVRGAEGEDRPADAA